MPNRPAQKKTLNSSKPPSPRWLKIVASLALSALVLGQVSYLGRDAIKHLIAKAPPFIQTPTEKAFSVIDKLICQLLPCQDRALSDFSAWSIEFANLEITAPSSKRQSSDPSGILKLQIRNQLNTFIAWPAIVLSITDANDVVIAEKVLQAKDWLPSELQSDAMALDKGATPLLEVSSNLPLALPEQAAGYRVRLSYLNKE